MSPPKTGLLFPILSGLWRAGLTDRFDVANFEHRANAARIADPTDGHFMTHVFGKTLDRESLGVQVRDHAEIMIVDQDVQSFLLIHATRQRRGLRLFLLLGFLRAALLLLRRHCTRDPHGENA